MVEQQYIDLFSQCEGMICSHSAEVLNAKRADAFADFERLGLPTQKLEDYKYTLEGFFARNTMVWLDVLEVFAKNDTNVVPVLDTNNKYLGYYELEDVVRFFQETPFLKEQGNILVVQKPATEYAMSQIAQIVESNNGKILGVFVSNLNQDNVEITIKIAVGSMNEIIQTFRRYNYEIVSQHEEDSYLENLKERSEYLDKYLKI